MSTTIARRLKGLGASYYLYTEKGGSHSWSFKPMTSTFNVVMDFLYYDVINNHHHRQTKQSIADE